MANKLVYEDVLDKFNARSIAGNAKGLFTAKLPQAGTSRSTVITASAATDGNLLPANATRSRYIIQNNGAAAIWIAYAGLATVGGLDCMQIGAGQFFAGDSDTTAISAISAAGSANVFVREW